MIDNVDNRAWNNFVLLSDPYLSEPDRSRHSAALANFFMGGANNGGLNSFLTSSYDFDSSEVLSALREVGAFLAAEELEAVLQQLTVPILKSSQQERWDILDRHWPEELEGEDSLSEMADAELMNALNRHVKEHQAFYHDLQSELR
jgi:hypothetical protein